MNKRSKLILLVILIAGGLFLSVFFYIRIVDATGGAFPYSKHGGATGNGVVRKMYQSPGVSAGDVYPSSVYASGECTQCHEPHASFGGNEPYPSSYAGYPSFMSATEADGPDPYLLFADNNAKLCWTCHETFSFTGKPGGWGYYGFYQGRDVYTASTHYTNPSVLNPGFGGTVIHPRKARPSAIGGASQTGICLNCHTPHGILGSGYDNTSPDGSGGVPDDRQKVNCASPPCNPSVTTDYLIPRQLIAWEEVLCENCHDASGPATKNIQSEINKRATGSGHPVDDTSLAGRHVVNESLPISWKHVECYDCHNPHAVRVGTNTPGDGNAGRITGMRYIDINGTVRDPAAGDRQPYILEVCFKCHSDSFDCIMTYKALGASDGTAGCTPLTTRNRGLENGAGLNAQLGASNKRKEFNPTTLITVEHGGDGVKQNGAYHPVSSPGRNTSIQLCNQLKTAFNLSCANQATATAELSNLTINCTDCHNNNDVDAVRGPITESSLRSTDKPSGYAGTIVTGPHGSTNKRLLRANYPTLIGTGSCTGRGGTPPTVSDRICFRCHDSTPFTTDSNSTWSNFQTNDSTWGRSLHEYHLTQATGDAIPIQCHECHNNVHSNVEANNTQYYSGGACCTGFPADGNTHLLNFGPNVTPDQYAKPAWYYDGNVFRCNLRCHGKTMSSCDYKGAYDTGGTPGGGGWC